MVWEKRKEEGGSRKREEGEGRKGEEGEKEFPAISLSPLSRLTCDIMMSRHDDGSGTTFRPSQNRTPYDNKPMNTAR